MVFQRIWTVLLKSIIIRVRSPCPKPPLDPRVSSLVSSHKGEHSVNTTGHLTYLYELSFPSLAKRDINSIKTLPRYRATANFPILYHNVIFLSYCATAIFTDVINILNAQGKVLSLFFYFILYCWGVGLFSFQTIFAPATITQTAALISNP